MKGGIGGRVARQDLLKKLKGEVFYLKIEMKYEIHVFLLQDKM